MVENESQEKKAPEAPLSPLLLGIPVVFGLALIAYVFWIVFGGTEARPGEQTREKSPSKLTKEEFTVIAADDDAESHQEQRDKTKEQEKEPSRSERESSKSSSKTPHERGERD